MIQLQIRAPLLTPFFAIAATARSRGSLLRCAHFYSIHLLFKAVKSHIADLAAYGAWQEPPAGPDLLCGRADC
jgi:hypothetical protein